MHPGRHLWDRKSGRYREEWELFGEQAQALFNVQTKEGRVFREGDEIEAAESAEVLEQAYYNHLNDSYWLLMPWKLTDPGVHLSNLGRETVNGQTYDVLHLIEESLKHRTIEHRIRVDSRIEPISVVRPLFDSSIVLLLALS